MVSKTLFHFISNTCLRLFRSNLILNVMCFDYFSLDGVQYTWRNNMVSQVYGILRNLTCLLTLQAIFAQDSDEVFDFQKQIEDAKYYHVPLHFPFFTAFIEVSYLSCMSFNCSVLFYNRTYLHRRRLRLVGFLFIRISRSISQSPPISPSIQPLPR